MTLIRKAISSLLVVVLAFAINGQKVSAYNNLAVLPSGGSTSIPTFQQVTTAGATTNLPITVNGCTGCGSGLYSGSSFVATSSLAVDYGTLASNQCDLTGAIQATGSVAGDLVILGLSGGFYWWNGYTYNGFVSSTDQVFVRRCNTRSATGGDPPPGTMNVEVRRN